MASYEQLALTGPGPQVLTGKDADAVLDRGAWRGFMGWSIEECKRAYVRRYSREPEHILVSGCIRLAGPIPTKAVTDAED